MTAHFDLLDAAYRHDPFPLYRRLREQDPVHWSPRLKMWVVTRYDDVDAILHRPQEYSVDRFRSIDERFLSTRPDMREVAAIMRDWAVYRDPPEHTRLRNLLNHAFTPRHLEAMRPRIQAVVDQLLDRVGVDETSDFIEAFAFPLPATVIGTMLGVPPEDLGQIKIWSDQIARYIGGAQAGKDNIDEAKRGLVHTCDYFHALLARRRAAPGDDLLSVLLAAEDRGEVFSDDELVSNCVLLLFAGHETTTNLLANGLFHLLHTPQQLAALRADPALVPIAVEECLRYDPPVSGTIRVARGDIALRGRTIPDGALVACMIAAANRDPAQFERPDDLDVTRQPNRHLAFGHGIHFCLGAGLARLEAQIAFTTILRRFEAVELAEVPGGTPQWKAQVFFRGLERLPVRLRSAAGSPVRARTHAGARR